jgi:hypothetical protein
MEWPDYFPENCPPSTAKAATGIVYRFVRKNPPENGDFIGYRLLHPLEDYKEKTCQACGISVYRDKNDLLKMQSRVPAKKGSHIAKGNLNPDIGQILPTPHQGDSHHTWWVPSGIQANDYFSVADIEGED